MKLAVLGSVLAVVVLGGCTKIVDHHGYIVDADLVSAVQPGVDNKASVEKTLGRPSFASEWNDNVWYYYARNTSELAFLPPKPIAQDLLVVTFDKAGNVASVDRNSTLQKVVQIDPVGDKTPVRGSHTSLFEDIFGNIGAAGGTPGVGGSGPNGSGPNGSGPQ